MREDLLRKYMIEVGAVNFRPRTNNGWMECPCVLAPWTHEKGYDSKASFAVLINDTGKSLYSCQQCKHKGSIPKLFYQFAQFTGEEKYRLLGREIEDVEIRSLANNIPAWEDIDAHGNKHVIKRNYTDPSEAFGRFPPAFYFKAPMRYMRDERKIKPQTLLRLNLRWDGYSNRILFPVYDNAFDLRGFVGRDITGKAKLKVKDYYGLNKEELFLGEDVVWRNRYSYKYVVIVEGIVDYAALRQAGFDNVLCILGSSITKYKFDKLISLNLPIVWFLDNDEGGFACIHGPKDKVTEERDTRKAALHMFAPFLPQMIAKYRRNETDPGSMAPARIKKAVLQAEYQIISS